MNGTTRATIVLIMLVAAALALGSCDGFFVSPNSVGSIQVSPTSAILSAGGSTTQTTQQLTVTAKLVNGNSGGDVTASAQYTSSNTKVVTVSTTGTANPGLVTAAGVGSATVTVTDGGQTAQVPFVVTSTPITNVSVTPSSTTLSTPGSSVQLKAMAQDGTDITTSVQWSSSNTSVATVGTNGSGTPGLVTAAANLSTLTSTSTTITAAISVTGQNLQATATVNVI